MSDQIGKITNEPYERFLRSMNMDPYNTDYEARQVASKAAERLGEHVNSVIFFDLGRNISSMSESVNTVAKYWELATAAWKDGDRDAFIKCYFKATKLQEYGEQCWDRLLNMTCQQDWSDEVH